MLAAPEKAPAPIQPVVGCVVLTGNPNCGKTTLFNALTGLRAKVGNYAGVTVERKEGRLLGTPKDSPVMVLDLPGTYSLTPQSLDEQISRDVLFHRLAEVPPADVVIVVVDASNLQRNLYFATQVIELGYPTILALNMVDVARDNGHEIDAAKLSQELGVPVVPTVGSTGKGVPELREKVMQASGLPTRGRSVAGLADVRGHSGAVSSDEASQTPCLRPGPFYELPKALEEERNILAAVLRSNFQESRFQAEAEALLLLSDEKFLSSS